MHQKSYREVIPMQSFVLIVLGLFFLAVGVNHIIFAGLGIGSIALAGYLVAN